MIEALRYYFLESHIRWLLYIVLFEYIVALTLSPTILSNYVLAQYFVDIMSFISAVHAFDDVAKYPEAVSFFIALAFVLLIPRIIVCYLFLKANPYSQMSQLVITPYTKYKPSRALNFGEELTEEEAKQLLTVERSMLSRVIWSLLSLGLSAGFIWICLEIGVNNDQDLILTQRINNGIANGGSDMWWSLSVCRISFAALMLATSFFIIKDYMRLFFSLFRRVIQLLKIK